MKISKEIKIASVAILSAIIVYVGIIFLKGLKLFNDEVSYFVEIADVQGMPTASDVRANGLKVGTVKAIKFNPAKQNLTVEITINPNFQIPEGTSVYMTKEMLGSAMMNLKLGPNPTAILQPGDTIQGAPLIDLMTDAVLSPEKAYSQLLINRVSSQYNMRASALFDRIQAVLDYVSGMTDVFALDLYRKLNGNSLPAV